MKTIINLSTFVGLMEVSMNIKDNKRKKESQEKIERIFLELIQKKEINEISVTDICKKANLNRTTFYSNYIDIYDLADKIREKLEQDILELYKEESQKKYNDYDFLKLFKHIKDNQLFYKTFFKLNFDLDSFMGFIDNNEVIRFLDSNKHLDYHVAFFKAGINAIIKKWLNGGCKETPEEILEVITSEYKGREIPE